VETHSARLALLSWGEDGEPLLFLHGIAGHAGEWSSAAAALRGPRFHCLAIDQRGHGLSERRPDDVSAEAFVSDVKAVLDAVVGTRPVHLLGQSFGGLIALLFAAKYPELVTSLIVVEASPSGPNLRAVADVRAWLESWPRPFTSRHQAALFFGGGQRADSWIGGLEVRDGQYWPRFDDDVILEALGQLSARSWWDEWQAVTARSLLIRGQHGNLDAADLDRMARSGPRPEVEVIPKAGHDVHLDQRDDFTSVVHSFLMRR